MASSLKEWHEKMVMVVTCDGRIVYGTFIGHDQVQNIILSNSYEQIYTPSNDSTTTTTTTTTTTSTDATSIPVQVECVPMGLHVIRGDTVCLIGEYSSTQNTTDNKDNTNDTTTTGTSSIPSITTIQVPSTFQQLSIIQQHQY